MATKKATSTEVTILEISKGEITCNILGRSPLICNAMSAKARQQLLFPPKKKNAAEKASTLKHEPMQEFRDSFYRAKDPNSDTLVVFPSTCFKNSMRGAAVDIPGSSKAQIGRLVWVNGDQVSIYGKPELMMSVTRSADMARTPDVRTRMIIPQWAAQISISFTDSLIKEQSVVNLLAAAGVMQGLGDWRTEKGKGDYGQYELVGADDALFKKIVAEGGREVQEAAVANPEPYDSETEQLLSWFDAEVARRGFKVVS